MVLNDSQISNWAFQKPISFALKKKKNNSNVFPVTWLLTIDKIQSYLAFYWFLFSRPRLHARKGLRLPTKWETQANMKAKGFIGRRADCSRRHRQAREPGQRQGPREAGQLRTQPRACHGHHLIRVNLPALPTLDTPRATGVCFLFNWNTT